jgi:hypothetical protein
MIQTLGLDLEVCFEGKKGDMKAGEPENGGNVTDVHLRDARACAIQCIETRLRGHGELKEP